MDSRTAIHHPFLVGLGGVAVAYLAFSAILLSIRNTFRPRAMVDMRTAMLESGHPVANPRLAPFEAVFPDGAGSVVWSGQGGHATIYLRGASWRDHGTAEVECPPGTWREVPIPVCLELDWDENAPRRVGLRRRPADDNAPLHLGHVDIMSVAPPAK